jgi:hypothetical protein
MARQSTSGSRAAIPIYALDAEDVVNVKAVALHKGIGS